MRISWKALAAVCTLLVVNSELHAQTATKTPAKPAAKPGAGKVAPKPAAKSAAPAVVLKNGLDSVSYSIGLSIGNSLISQKLQNVNKEALYKALGDVLGGKQGLISLEEAHAFISGYFQKQSDAESEPNRIAGEKFLAENKKREGVVTTASGLQYEVIKAGEGAKPTSSDKVKVHYHGTLVDGSVFDSSVERGEPIEFPVMGVIQGWQEVLQLMPVGSKWKVYIPYQIAYGDRAAGKIGAKSALIFDIELLDIVKTASEAQNP